MEADTLVLRYFSCHSIADNGYEFNFRDIVANNRELAMDTYRRLEDRNVIVFTEERDLIYRRPSLDMVELFDGDPAATTKIISCLLDKPIRLAVDRGACDYGTFIRDRKVYLAKSVCSTLAAPFFAGTLLFVHELAHIIGADDQSLFRSNLGLKDNAPSVCNWQITEYEARAEMRVTAITNNLCDFWGVGKLPEDKSADMHTSRVFGTTWDRFPHPAGEKKTLRDSLYADLLNYRKDPACSAEASLIEFDRKMQLIANSKG